MKILQVNSVFRTGSTGKITYDIHEGLLNSGYEAVVCYGRGKKTTMKNVYKVCSEFNSYVGHFFSEITGLMYGGFGLSTHKLKRIIKQEQPDIVHLQCINNYFINIYEIISWLKNNNIKTVLTLHAEFMYTANCGIAYECEKWKSECKDCPRWRKETKSFFFNRTHDSWIKMKNAFEGFDNLTVVSVSPWLMNRAKQSPIFKDKQHMVVYNGLDCEIFHPYETEEIKESLGIKFNTKVVFYATPIFNMDRNHLKGGYYLFELAKKMKDAIFVVAGAYDSSIKYPNNMKMLGRIENQETLAKLYSMADVTVLTSKRETFSMVCAESLCCGTPVVGFYAGGPELISMIEYSRFSEYGNIEILNKNIRELWDIKNSNDFSEEAQNIYGKDRMCQEYESIYLNMQ